MTTERTSKGSAVLTLPAENQILITRWFAAPPAHVWQVFTEPDLIRRWWAGRRGTVTSAEVDLTVGGRWRYAMDSDGAKVSFRGVYREVVPGERLVCTEIYESGPGATDEEPGALCTYTFTPADGGTALALLTEVADRATRDAIVASGMEGGVQEGYDLAEEIATGLSPGSG